MTVSNASALSTSSPIGTVVAVQANFYHVQLDDGTSILCTRRTRLKKTGQKVMVGDRVAISIPAHSEARGAITQVFARQSEFQRPPVANAQQILLLFAVEEPSLDPWQLSRFLVKAESTSLKLCLCLNKIDLISENQRQFWQQRLLSWGYQPIFTSVIQQQGLDILKQHLNNQITILAGPSGVGKSSLINTLIPQVEQRVSEVSGKLQRGRHTTRHVELFPLADGGLLADTPGFNQPELDGNPMTLASYFPEVRQRLVKNTCQFKDCYHRDEPNCAVRGDWERYPHYLEFLQEVMAHQAVHKQLNHPESRLKRMVKQSGQEQYEPKLETKKYRRLSRRQKHQKLQDMYDNKTLEEMEALDED